MPSLKVLLRQAACAFLLIASALPLKAQAPLLIYTDSLVCGFQDWSWGARGLTNSSPVHSGTNSIAASLNAWEALSFAHSEFDTTLYASLSFWAHGGTAGGQRLQVYAQYGANSGSAYSLAALPTNSWRQFTIPLSSLGVAATSNLYRLNLQLTASGTTGTFYIDDVQLNASPAPALVHLGINASQTIRTVDARCFGINTAMWDSYLDTTQTISLLNRMGARMLRCLGGSASDEYHWAGNKSLTNSWAWASSFANFLHVATNTGVQVITTVNYGTGSANEAAAWVAYANGASTNTLSLGADQYGTNWQTVGYWASLRAASPLAKDDGKNFLRIARSAPLSFKYWEIGNECYGTWETDSNAVAHDPYTYATRALNYLQLKRKVDATIKIGVVATPGESSYSNNANHYALNSRTSQTNYGWTPIVLATLKNLGVTPDFLIHHSYATADCDPLLLQAADGPDGWVGDAASLRQMLTDYFGVNGTNVELCVTENNSASNGKQLTSLVNAVFLADSLSQLLQTEFNSFLWWDLRNGASTNGALDSSVYGWRAYGDEGVIGGLTNCYPSYYGFKLMQHFAQAPDNIVSATSDYRLLSAYAACRTNGTLSLLVLNKDTTTNMTAQIVLTNFLPVSTAMARSYVIPQDEAARTNGSLQAQDIATNAVSNITATLTYTFPALSLTLFTFSPAVAPAIDTQPLAQSVSPGSNVAFAVAASGTAPLTYQWRFNGANLANATNASLTVTNAQPANEGGYTVVVTNNYGSVTSATAALRVLQPPVITRQPQGLAVVAGGQAALSVAVTGRSPFTYQWRTNGTALPDQTNSALGLAGFQAAKAAAYSVAVTNADGWVLSDTATLTLAISPAIKNLSYSAGKFGFSVPTEIGPTYSVEYTHSLDGPSWQSLTNILGAGALAEVVDPGATDTNRFYRIRLQ